MNHKDTRIYADDVSVPINTTQQHLALEKEMHSYNRASNSKLNSTKTRVLCGTASPPVVHGIYRLVERVHQETHRFHHGWLPHPHGRPMPRRHSTPSVKNNPQTSRFLVLMPPIHPGSHQTHQQPADQLHLARIPTLPPRRQQHNPRPAKADHL